MNQTKENYSMNISVMSTLSSRNEIVAYTKSKGYDEDLKELILIPLIANMKAFTLEEVKIEEEREVDNEYTLSSSIPEDKKDDETYKALKIEKMNRVKENKYNYSKSSEYGNHKTAENGIKI
jgi:hypothetical protein